MHTHCAAMRALMPKASRRSWNLQDGGGGVKSQISPFHHQTEWCNTKSQHCCFSSGDQRNWHHPTHTGQVVLWWINMKKQSKKTLWIPESRNQTGFLFLTHWPIGWLNQELNPGLLHHSGLLSCKLQGQGFRRLKATLINCSITEVVARSRIPAFVSHLTFSLNKRPSSCRSTSIVRREVEISTSCLD